MIAFPGRNMLLISSAIEFWFVKVIPKYLNSSTLSKVLLSILTLWIRPAFWSPDLTMYFVLSAFTSSPIFLVAATKAYGSYYMLILVSSHSLLYDGEVVSSHSFPFFATIRSPNRRSRSQSLYRLSYRAHSLISVSLILRASFSVVTCQHQTSD